MEQQLKTMGMLPSGFMPAHPAAYQNKMAVYPSYSLVPMWHYLPPSTRDTSHDHELRPPAAQFLFPYMAGSFLVALSLCHPQFVAQRRVNINAISVCLLFYPVWWQMYGRIDQECSDDIKFSNKLFQSSLQTCFMPIV